MSWIFDCVDLSEEPKRQCSLAQMAAESKALLEEHRKRSAPKTKAQPSKRQKQFKSTTSSHNPSSERHSIKHHSPTPALEDEEDEPLINRLRVRRQQAILSIPPLMQDVPQPAQQLQPLPQDPGQPSQDRQPHLPSPAMCVSIWPELVLTQQELEELDLLDQQMKMERQAKEVSESQLRAVNMDDSWPQVWGDTTLHGLQTQTKDEQ
ncbi:hypothetical protein BGZ82_003459, partial [Podila clonocystis]